MHTVGRDIERPGLFAYELHAGFDLIERVGGFATKADAERAATLAERRLCLCGYDANAYRDAHKPAGHETIEELRALLADFA